MEAGSAAGGGKQDKREDATVTRVCDKNFERDTPCPVQIRPSEGDCAQVVQYLTHANPSETYRLGAKCAYDFATGSLFRLLDHRGETTELKPLALASRACNH